MFEGSGITASIETVFSAHRMPKGNQPHSF